MLTNIIFENIKNILFFSQTFFFGFFCEKINISENNVIDVKATKVLWYMVTN